jgi:hypothetical protein
MRDVRMSLLVLLALGFAGRPAAAGETVYPPPPPQDQGRPYTR